ncbi:MAG TPA: Dyp-type peroxidase [Methylomirabilota bacterium]|jgi:Dyp-type peroxidase family|nr:Dyp-type peroxidase [Methylomirabilota bacterium]
MTEGLPLDWIQGNITPGFGTDYQAFLLVRFGTRRAARRWLDGLRSDVTSAAEVTRFREAQRRRRGEDFRAPRATFVNVAFSWAGLARLGAPDRERFPAEFRAGMYARATATGDDPAAMTGWEVGGSARTEAHALLLVTATTAADRRRAVRRQQARLAAHGIRELARYDGARLTGGLRGREHFGFRDSISQPRFDLGGPTDPYGRPDDLIATGEFVLGYPDERGESLVAGPPWARDGSYAVFRRLQQHVAAFRQAARRRSAQVGLSPAQFAAKLFGRWPSGAKLGDRMESADPGWDESDETARWRGTEFAADPDGERVPRFAHVRKAHPLDLPDDAVRRHRLLRRGIPYGPRLPARALKEDGQDRGLLFLAYQASLAHQFEHVQRRWIDNASFPCSGDGPDAMAGGGTGERTVTFRVNGRCIPVSLQSFVSVRGGGYFFVPSIRALAYLADLRGKWEEDHDMAKKAAPAKPKAKAKYSDFEEYVRKENVYGPDYKLPDDLDADSRIEGKTNVWYFEGRPRRVAKSIRIPYTYKTANGQPVTEHLLIGYEGGPGL